MSKGRYDIIIPIATALLQIWRHGHVHLARRHTLSNRYGFPHVVQAIQVVVSAHTTLDCIYFH